MLEVNAKLKTWRLSQPLGDDMTQIECEPLQDHRIEYLDYEGPVSNNRGVVKRIDRGDYTFGETSSSEAPLQVTLEGQELAGTVTFLENAIGWDPQNQSPPRR